MGERKEAVPLLGDTEEWNQTKEMSSRWVISHSDCQTTMIVSSMAAAGDDSRQVAAAGGKQVEKDMNDNPPCEDSFHFLGKMLTLPRSVFVYPACLLVEEVRFWFVAPRCAWEQALVERSAKKSHDDVLCHSEDSFSESMVHATIFSTPPAASHRG